MNKSLALLVLGLALALPARAQENLTPIRVALIAPLSGSVPEVGRDLRAAATLALIKARKEFQKLGFDLQLKSFDDKMSVDTAKAAARDILADKDTLVTVGSYASEVTLTLAQTFRDGKLALIVPAAADTGLTGPDYDNVTRVVARNDQVGRAAGQYLQKALKAKKVLLIHDNTDDGLDANENLANYLKAEKVGLAGQIRTAERTAFPATLERIRQLKPDAIALGFSSYESAARLVAEIRKEDKDVPILGTAVFSDPKFAQLAGPSARGVYYASYAAPVGAYASGAIPNFIKEYGQILVEAPTSFSVLGYDAMQVALEGLRGAVKANKGKRPSRAQVEKALRAVTVEDALSGKLRFNASGDLLETSAYVMRYSDDLQPKLVSIVPVQAGVK